MSDLKKALKFAPNDSELIVALSHTYDLMGDIDKALEILEPFFASGTDTPEMARKRSSMHFERKEYDQALAVLSRHLGSPHVSPQLAESILLLLGQIYERLGDIDKSFKAYEGGNNIRKPEGDPKTFIKYADETMQAFSKEAMARLPRAKNTSRLPVFIVCRPRSGSTLVERIIASHPQVHAGGEREAIGLLQENLGLYVDSSLAWPFCVRDMDQNDADRLASEYLTELQALAPKAKRITDKNVGMWQNVGLINLLFPKAIVIDLRREAVDNCLGCFTVQLADDPTKRDLHTLGIQHREYERFMDHWHAVCDFPILKVNYEDIVADQEYWSRKIIEHCGLEWDDRVLRFYEKGAQQSTTANPTLSFKQVRQPIYKSSVARAKKFEKHLQPLYEGLGLKWPPES